MATAFSTSTTSLLTQVTPDTKKEGRSSFFSSGVHIKTEVISTVFLTYYALLATALLAVAVATGAVRLATIKDVLLMVFLGALIVCYFVSLHYASNAVANAFPVFAEPFRIGQCFVQALCSLLISRALSAYSLNSAICSAFIMLVQVWLVIVFIYIINFTDKKQKANLQTGTN